MIDPVHFSVFLRFFLLSSFPQSNHYHEVTINHSYTCFYTFLLYVYIHKQTWYCFVFVKCKGTLYHAVHNILQCFFSYHYFLDLLMLQPEELTH